MGSTDPPSDAAAKAAKAAAAAAAGFQRDDQQEEVYQKPLPAARRDLKISPQLYLGKTIYMVKDPVSLTYFRLNPAEHHVVRNLDGRRSANDLAEAVNARFPEQPIDPQDVLSFIKMMQGSGLLLGKGEAHAEWLRGVRDTRRRKKLTAQVTNFLFIKIPLIDPDRALDAIYSYSRLLMNRWTMMLAITFMVLSTVVAIGALFRTGLNLMFPLLAWQNLLILSGVFFAVKVIHEFGHGLAAKLRGLEVHDMGVLLMVFLPMFYVDVSDAWMVPRRRDRLWITAGGVFVEFLFASLCVWLWLFTEPGVVNQVAFNIMVSASITTVLFNANPLLRYDGYYFMMDWLEIPNLKSKSGKFMAYLGKKYILAMPDQTPPRETAQRPILIPIFAVASGIYRWVIVFGIIGLVYAVLDPYGLEAIGALMAMVAVTTMIIMPLAKLLRFVWSQQAKTARRMAATVAGIAAVSLVVWGILSFSTEDTIERPLVVLAEERQPVLVPFDGRVAEVFVTRGQHVSEGDPLVRLSGNALQDELKSLRLERELLTLARERARQDGSIDQVAAAKPRLNQLDRRIAHLEDRVDRLTIRAPIDGRLSPLVRLEGLLGTYLSANDELGLIVGEGERELVMVIPQHEASLLNQGMNARVRLWAASTHVYHGKVDRVGSNFVERLPHDAISSVYSGEVDTVRSQEYKSSPSTPSVLARIVLNDPLPSRGDGLTGRGRIVLGDSSIGKQQWRKIRHLLSLDWWL
ncbi:MAG: HlyD family efflux transporter periplasmic adaptor subunit [Phycisphaeraceae bacterium]